jgi:hypothetical protein
MLVRVEASRPTSASPARPAPFEPVPLPLWQPGHQDVGELERVLRQWATSPPVRALAEASGWPWPACAGTQDLLGRLAELSAAWDFRARRERDAIPDGPAVVGDRVVPDDLIRAAAAALGLVTSQPLPRRSFSHLVVLSGLVRACVNRTRYAAGMLRDGVAAGSVTVLGAHRELSGGELAQARDLGFGEPSDEAEVIVAAARRAFGLSDPPARQEEQEEGAAVPDGGPPDNAERMRGAWARYQWPAASVVIAPSREPAIRRANTADQLLYWADLEGIDQRHHVLLVTTQIYVPYQHLEALRVLGLARGCGVYSCGVDPAGSLLPAKAFSGQAYLQEVRSALCAAAALLATARQATARQATAPQATAGAAKGTGGLS